MNLELKSSFGRGALSNLLRVYRRWSRGGLCIIVGGPARGVSSPQSQNRNVRVGDSSCSPATPTHYFLR
jgi:hypothetical protein